MCESMSKSFFAHLAYNEDNWSAEDPSGAYGPPNDELSPFLCPAPVLLPDTYIEEPKPLSCPDICVEGPICTQTPGTCPFQATSSSLCSALGNDWLFSPLQLPYSPNTAPSTSSSPAAPFEPPLSSPGTPSMPNLQENGSSGPASWLPDTDSYLSPREVNHSNDIFKKDSGNPGSSLIVDWEHTRHCDETTTTRMKQPNDDGYNVGEEGQASSSRMPQTSVGLKRKRSENQEDDFDETHPDKFSISTSVGHEVKPSRNNYRRKRWDDLWSNPAPSRSTGAALAILAQEAHRRAKQRKQMQSSLREAGRGDRKRSPSLPRTKNGEQGKRNDLVGYTRPSRNSKRLKR